MTKRGFIVFSVLALMACGTDEGESDGPPFLRATVQLKDGSGEHSFEVQPHVYYAGDRTSCEGNKDYWGGMILWPKGAPPAVGSHTLPGDDANGNLALPAISILFPEGDFVSGADAVSGTLDVTRSEGRCVSVAECDVVLEGTFANVVVTNNAVVSSLSTGSFRCVGQ